MLTIAQSTFKEIYRKKIFHFIGILTIIYLILLTIIFRFIGKNLHQNNGMIDMVVNLSSTISIVGFYFSSMLLGFLTIMLSIGTVSSEIENGTILTILTKPIRRSEYILGKYLGTAILIILYSIVLYIAVIIISTVSKISIIEAFGIGALVKGFLFFILQPLTILSVSLYGSTKFKTLNNGILIMSLYILGLIGGVMEQLGAYTKNDSLSTIGIISSLISPFEVIYRKMISAIFTSLGSFNLLSGFSMTEKSTTPSLYMMFYVCIYLVFFIFISVKSFAKKDIG
ncbi:ABC transporter permease [Clostridium carboxidivorans P7]|uniref:ABC-type transport system involved in multi-copper enzyme maturation, permease component n=1 Tax=Clostridium carboxidivorans P7 TaxID=536227 RepID=C6PWA8_9CLOT|nr:ABC transporter permease [Clostridium carboxidivorans]AKN29748.1 ABC transporter permease [Clostridium carboxidivorans P7]EET86458.1 ABC-type transport system involved in multi-copper enzyme maturation, permease component [Clostridium carboxidivorans P7]EFG89308.1 membrane protein, putative [Clostridium carboxidivorans P7]